MSKKYKRMQPRQQKANPAYVGMSLISDMPQPRSMPRNYKSYAKEGYGANDTLFKVVNYIISNGAAIPPKLYTDRTMQKEITSHPLLDKLDAPNPEQDGVSYRESILGYYLITGNSFQYAIRTNKSGPPDELWVLQPDLMRPIPDENRGITGYEYEAFPKEKNPIIAELICHMKTWNPEDPIWGLSPVQVAAIIIDMQTALRKWNLALLQNFARPSGAWTTTALLSPNERSKLEEKVNQRMAGYRNAGKAPVLDGALKWESSAYSPSELDWQNSDIQNSGRIANILDIPPQLVGDTSSTTYNNMKEAKAASYTEGIFPRLDKMYSGWNRWLVPMYPDLKGARLYYDKKTVEVIAEIVQANLTAAAQRSNQSYIQGTMMLDEAREMQGKPPLPNGAGQVFRIGAVLVPADKLQEYAEQSLTTPAAPPPAQPEPLDETQSEQPLQGNKPQQSAAQNTEKPNEQRQENDNAEEDKKHGQFRYAHKRTEDTHSARTLAATFSENAVDGQNKGADVRSASVDSSRSRKALLTKSLDLSTAEEKVAYAKSLEDTRKKWEDQYIDEIASHFDRERNAVVDAINESTATGALAGKAEGVINDQSIKLEKILLSLYEDVCVDVGGQVAADLAGEKGIVRDFLSLFGDSQLKYLLTLAGVKIKEITTNTLAKVRLQLTDGVTQGESIPELAKRIDSLYLEQIIPNRSTVIARTEVIGSSNYASNEAAKQSGLSLHKVYLATDDSRTRPDHADADGQEVAMDEPFEVGGYKMMYPGDSSMGAPADEIIQCRCTQYYKRVQTTGQDDDMTDEKRRRRVEYRRFMEATS